MTNEQTNANIFKRIRADAEKKRKVKMAEKQRNDEYFARMKNGTNPLDEINQILTGENK